MTIHISETEVQAALAELEALQRRRGSAKTLERCAAQTRANAIYLARWTGPAVAAEFLSREAHRLVAVAASEIAVPNAEIENAETAKPLPRQLAKAAVLSLSILGAFLLGLGVSALA